MIPFRSGRRLPHQRYSCSANALNLTVDQSHHLGGLAYALHRVFPAVIFRCHTPSSRQEPADPVLPRLRDSRWGQLEKLFSFILRQGAMVRTNCVKASFPSRTRPAERRPVSSWGLQRRGFICLVGSRKAGFTPVHGESSNNEHLILKMGNRHS